MIGQMAKVAKHGIILVDTQAFPEELMLTDAIVSSAHPGLVFLYW